MADDESMYTTILLDEQGPIARITLNRPDKRNPIGPATCGELVHALTRIKTTKETRVVVLTGAGPVFSAGGDLAAMQQPLKEGVVPASLVELFVAMHELGKPIICMVNGHALAGGLGLMVACDLVVASDAALFGTTEISVGLWPMMITAEITRSVGRKQALEMMLTGKRMTAAEALAAGLVNRVVPAAELEGETLKLALQIAEKSPAAIALGLKAFYRSQDMEFEPQLRYLQAELSRVLALEDAAEGIAAFLGKRPPVWKGR
jgi:enoyl-CoA hydratase